jgi:hypothetical protein
MKMFEFDSKVFLGEKLPEFDEKTVKDEPMFFSATPAFAHENGGPITKAFLEAVFGNERMQVNACFDSRVHMLMPGWWPCIPGWHHDDVPRSRSDGQPNYEDPANTATMVLALVNGDISPTQFAVGKQSYPEVPLFGPNVYEVWNDLVNQDVEEGALSLVSAPSNQLVHFDHNAFHRGSKCVRKGWRWFGRLTWNAGYENGRPHHNEIRRQVNVYMDQPMKGW